MTGPYPSDLAFTSAVKAQQDRLRSRDAYARMEAKGGWQTTVTADLAAFIAERDSFYLATANGDGHPYVQHRGGPKGFLKVLDEQRLAFADFSGNRQYITLGNLTENDKVFLFLMDYANRRRVKIWGRARFEEQDADLLERLMDADYAGRPERAVVIDVDVWDVNCPQHITPRFTEEDLAPAIGRLHARIAELEAELASLRGVGASV